MAENEGGLPAEEQEMEEDQHSSENDDESEEEDGDDEEYFEVEKLMARKKRDGVFLYRVRWKGYPPSNDTWEPVDNLEVVADMVEEFDAKEEDKANARREERRLRKLRMEGKKLPGEESSDSSNSSDDERLLNEDTKFFKMLEKNKDIVFGQPDLYSKVKSRAATLASKKKGEESQSESKPSKLQPAEREINRRKGRNKMKPSTQVVKSSTRVRQGKKANHTDSDEDSEDSPVQRKTTRRGRSRHTQKLISDSSEEDTDRSSRVDEEKRRKEKPQRKAVEDSESDSSDSIPLSKCTRRVQDKSQKKLLLDSSEENGSDSSSVCRKHSILTGGKQVRKKCASDRTTAAERKLQSSVSDRENVKGLLASDSDRHSSMNTKSEKTTSETDITKGKCTESQSAEQGKGDKAVASKQPSATSQLSPVQPSSEKTLPLRSSVQPRVIVPVLEKLAQSTPSLRIGDIEKQCADGEKTSSSSVSHQIKDSNTEIFSSEKVGSGFENMETETPQKKQNEKDGKKGSSSRKRKQDTATEHSKAVREGGASPLKASPLPPCSPDDAQSPHSEPGPPTIPMETNHPEVLISDLGNDDTSCSAVSPPVLQRMTPHERKVPPLRITVPKLKICPPKLQAESSKLSPRSPKVQAVSTKGEKHKLKGDNLKSAKCDHHPSSDVKPTQPSKYPPGRSIAPELPAVTFLNSVPSVRSGTSSTTVKKETTSKPTSATGVSGQHSGTGKFDTAVKSTKTSTTDNLGSVKQENAQCKHVKGGELGDRTGRQEQMDHKSARMDFTDSRKKSKLASELLSASPRISVNRDSVFASSSVRDTAAADKDSVISHANRNASGYFSGASTSRDIPSLYCSVKDSSSSVRGTNFTSSSSVRDSPYSPSLKDLHVSSGSSKDMHFGIGSSRDPHLGSSSGGDIRLGAGYIHLSSGSGRDSLFSSAGRDSRFDPKDTCAGSSRHAANLSISGKENADRQHIMKSTSAPKKMDGVQPLDTILNSSLYSDGDRSKHFKGLDSDFELALQRIDLEYLEKLLLPPVTPMELSDEELRQAVMDGNCYLVERALACAKPYNLNLPDNKGNTLLMNAVLRGSDDIIVHLLSRGADAQVQVNGVTALMLAVEHAESSTVFMLLEMGAHVNTADHSGETALFKAVRRGDKQILKLILDHGADFSLTASTGLSSLQMAKQYRLADIETTLIDHIQKVVRSFEEQVNLTVRGTAKLVSCLFPHHCVPLYESDTITIPFKYQPSMPSGPGMGCLLFIAHARFSAQEVKCRLYGQCAVERVTLNGVLQPCLTEESNFVLMCHPLITGWNELVIQTKRDSTSKAKLIVCAYKAQLIYK